MKILTTFVALACLLLISGCFGNTSTELKALNPYAKAPLTAGSGLGDIQLGKTTLGWLVSNIGSGNAIFIMGDESAIELHFLNGQASFMFIVSGPCRDETGGPGARVEIGKDVKVFLSRYPRCNELRLSSISMATGQNTQAETFYKGSTDRGVGLWSPKSDAYKHGPPLNNPGKLVAGENYRNEKLDRLEFPGGIYFYFPAGAGATAEEEMSGRPLPPERLREIEESAKKAAKDATIRRITIFIPDR